MMKWIPMGRKFGACQFIGIIFLLITCTTSVAGSGKKQVADANVREIRGDAVFSSTLKITPLVFVKFYHPGCPHCQAIAPIYSSVASSDLMRAESDVLRFAAVDASVKNNSNLVTIHSPDGVPTLKLFKKGKLYGTYDGIREKQDIIKWLSGLIARYKVPTVTYLQTREARDTFLEKWSGTCVVLAYLPRGYPEACPDEFASIADEAQSAPGTAPIFATVSNVQLLGGIVRISMDTYAREPRVLVLRNASTSFNNPVWWTPGIWGIGNMRSFIISSTTPRDGSAILTSTLASALINEPSVLYVFGDRSTPDDFTSEELRKFANIASDRALVVYAYDQKWNGLMKHLGILNKKDINSPLPQSLRIVLCRLGSKISDKVLFNDSSSETVENWLNRILLGHYIQHRGLAGIMNRFDDRAWHAVVEHETRILILIVCGKRALIQADCSPIENQVSKLRLLAHAVHVENFDGHNPPRFINGEPFKLPNPTTSNIKPYIAVIPPGEKPRVLNNPNQILPTVLSILNERAPGHHDTVPIQLTDAVHLHSALLGVGFLILGTILSVAIFTSKRHRILTETDKSV